MYPYIQILLPSYAVFAFIGGIVVTFFLFFRIDRYQISFSDFLRILPANALGAFVGGKLLFAVTSIPQLVQNFSIQNLLLLVPQSGLVFYGGLLGAVFCSKILAKKLSIPFQCLSSFLAPGYALFHFFGRIGCFMAGCCYGKSLSQPIILFGAIQINAYPVQLIEAFFELALFFLLLRLEHLNKGSLLRVYLAVYAVFRFWVEFLRGDAVRGIWGPFSTSQWISLAIVLFLVFFSRRARAETVSSPEAPEPETER